MEYHTLFLSKIRKKMSQNLSSAAVVIGALRVKETYPSLYTDTFCIIMLCVSMDSYIWFYTMHLRCSIVYIAGSQGIISKK